MGFLGNLIGQGAGHLIGGFVGGKQGSDLGAKIGGMAGGDLIPFKKGGKVKKTTPALLHKNEFVLPANVKPTKAQMDKVKKMGGKM